MELLVVFVFFLGLFLGHVLTPQVKLGVNLKSLDELVRILGNTLGDTEVNGIVHHLWLISEKLNPKPIRQTYDIGEQLNTIVKILSRAFPPEGRFDR